jgi:hypothetical protein
MYAFERSQDRRELFPSQTDRIRYRPRKPPGQSTFAHDFESLSLSRLLGVSSNSVTILLFKASHPIGIRPVPSTETDLRLLPLRMAGCLLPYSSRQMIGGRQDSIERSSGVEFFNMTMLSGKEHERRPFQFRGCDKPDKVQPTFFTVWRTKRYTYLCESFEGHETWIRVTPAWQYTLAVATKRLPFWSRCLWVWGSFLMG